MEFPNREYKGLQKPTVLSATEFRNLQKYLNCDIFKNLKMLQKIGSRGSYATVWLASFNSVELDVTFAIKVQNDIQKSEKEGKISSFLETWSDNFLLMYYQIRWQRIILNNSIY